MAIRPIEAATQGLIGTSLKSLSVAVDGLLKAGVVTKITAYIPTLRRRKR